MKRILLLLGTVAGLSVIAVVGSFTRSTPATVDVTAALDACKKDVDCLRQAIDGAVLENPVAAADKITSYYRTPRVASMPCHTALHIVGQVLATRFDAGSAPDLGPQWSACSFGLLHGLVESQDYGDDPASAGPDAYRTCSTGPFADVPALMEACLHALGHSLYDAFTTDPLAQAEHACAIGARAFGGPRLAGPCLNGVYMRDRDARFPSPGWGDFDTGIPVHAQLTHCELAAQPVQCAILYSQAALNTAPPGRAESFAAFFTWCSALESQMRQPWPTCAYNLGWAAATVERSAAAELGLCSRLPGPSANSEYCIAGMLGGRLITGMPESQARTEICAALDRDRCAALRSLVELRTASPTDAPGSD